MSHSVPRQILHFMATIERPYDIASVDYGVSIQVIDTLDVPALNRPTACDTVGHIKIPYLPSLFGTIGRCFQEKVIKIAWGWIFEPLKLRGWTSFLSCCKHSVLCLTVVIVKPNMSLCVLWLCVVYTLRVLPCVSGQEVCMLPVFISHCHGNRFFPYHVPLRKCGATRSSPIS